MYDKFLSVKASFTLIEGQSPIYFDIQYFKDYVRIKHKGGVSYSYGLFIRDPGQFTVLQKYPIAEYRMKIKNNEDKPIWIYFNTTPSQKIGPIPANSEYEMVIPIAYCSTYTNMQWRIIMSFEEKLVNGLDIYEIQVWTDIGERQGALRKIDYVIENRLMPIAGFDASFDGHLEAPYMDGTVSVKGTPIPYATIRVENISTLQTYYIATDAAGKYHINVADAERYNQFRLTAFDPSRVYNTMVRDYVIPRDVKNTIGPFNYK